LLLLPRPQDDNAYGGGGYEDQGGAYEDDGGGDYGGDYGGDEGGGGDW
jgi:hypothetical protein